MDDPQLSDRYRPLTPGITRVPFGEHAALDGAIGDDTAAVIDGDDPGDGWLHRATRTDCSPRSGAVAMSVVPC